MKRVKDIIAESILITEAQIRDASPQFQQFSDAVSGASQAIQGALGEISKITSAAKSALDAISAASQTAQAIGVESDAIVDDINMVQQVDPSQSVITLTDHRPGVQQAYNILSTIRSQLGSAMSLCGKLNMLASRQFRG
jgi:ABC-type transporter Mla subunit MlaD